MGEALGIADPASAFEANLVSELHIPEMQEHTLLEVEKNFSQLLKICPVSPAAWVLLFKPFEILPAQTWGHGGQLASSLGPLQRLRES